MKKSNIQQLIGGVLSAIAFWGTFWLPFHLFGDMDINVFTDGTEEVGLEAIYLDHVRHGFINCKVNKFAMYGYNNDSYQLVPNGWGGQNGSNAVALLEDNLLGTGYVYLRGAVDWNPPGHEDGLGLTFNAPVTNSPGPDIMIFEWGDSDWEQKLYVIINGTQVVYTNSDNGVCSDSGVRVDTAVWSDPDTPAITLDTLENSCDFSQQGTIYSNQPIGYIAIDLSDFGVDPGGTCSDIRLFQWGAQDIVAVVGLVADPCDIEVITDGSNEARLKRLVVNGKERAPVKVKVTGLSMFSTCYTYQFVPEGWSGQNGLNAVALLEDNLLGTGLAALQGVEVNDKGLMLSFNRPVKNRPGPDIVIFEWEKNDWDQRLYVVINGITRIYKENSVYKDSGIFTDSVMWVDPDTPANTLSALKTCEFSTVGPVVQGAEIGYRAIYLEDFGVLPGESIKEIQLWQWGAPDIAAVVGLALPGVVFAVTGPPPSPPYGLWTSSKLGGGGYMQNVVCCPSHRSRYYAYCDVGGTFRSNDGGRSWRMLHGALEPLGGLYRTRGLIVHPENADDVLIAVGDQWKHGLYRSLDGGNTWKKKLDTLFLGNGPFREAGFVLTRNPTNPECILAASVGEGIWRSDDGGDTWNNIGLNELYPTDIRCDQTDPDRIWVCARPISGTYGEYNGGFYRSDDGGESWKKLSDDSPYELLQDVNDPSRLYGLFDYRMICKSQDAGDSWTAITNGLPITTNDVLSQYTSTNRFNALAAGPDFILTASAEGTFYRLPSGSNHWEKIECEAIHDEGWWGAYDHFHYGKALGAITIDPHNPDHWFFTDWFALYQTHDAGRNWDLSIDGIETTVLHTFAQDPTVPDLVHMGMADNGYLVSWDGGKSFTQVPLPNGGNNVKHIVVAPSDPARVYIAACRGWEWRSNHIYMSKDRGISWTRSAMTGLPDGDEYNFNTIAVSMDNPDHVVLVASGTVEPGKGGPYLSVDGGNTWEWIGEGLPCGEALYSSSIWNSHVQIAAGNELEFVTVAGGNSNHVFRYDSTSSIWTPVDIGSGDIQPACVVSVPHESGCIYYTCGSYGVTCSSDGGNTWTNICTTSASRIAVDMTMPNRIAIGTWCGVLVSQNSGATWLDYTPTLPNRTHPKPVFCGNKLIVGTGGNGAFWTTLETTHYFGTNNVGGDDDK